MTYKRDYECDNCGHSGPHELQRGTVAPQKRECPGCGCETATLVSLHKPRVPTDVPNWPHYRKPFGPMLGTVTIEPDGPLYEAHNGPAHVSSINLARPEPTFAVKLTQPMTTTDGMVH